MDNRGKQLCTVVSSRTPKEWNNQNERIKGDRLKKFWRSHRLGPMQLYCRVKKIHADLSGVISRIIKLKKQSAKSVDSSFRADDMTRTQSPTGEAPASHMLS